MYNVIGIYLKSMLMKKIIILLILIASGVNALFAESSYRSYSVVDGLSNSTVKAIYQDEMGYIWLGTKDGLNRLDGYEIKSFFYESEETVRQSNDIVSITGDGQGRMWIGTFNGVALFDPFAERYIDLNTLYQGDELPRGVVVGLWIAPDKSVWVVTKMGVYVLRDGKCICMEDLKGLYINSMAPCTDESLLLNVANKGILRLDTRTSDYSYILDGPDYPAFLKIFLDVKGRTWLASSLGNLQLYDCPTRTVTKIKVKLPADMGLWEGQVHDIKVYNDSTLLLATDNGLAVMDEHNYTIRRTFEERIPVGLLSTRRLMALYKDRQGSLWFGTFNEGALFYNSAQYLFRYHSLTANVNQPVRVNGKLIEAQGKLWIGHNSGICTLSLTDGKVENILLPMGKNSKGDDEVYYMFRNSEDEVLFYVLNKGVYSLNLKTLSINRQMAALSPNAQIRAMAKDILGNIWIAENELSCYNPQTQTLSRSFSTNQDGDTRFMLTQDLLPYGTTMLVGGRTSGVWRFPYHPKEAAHYFKGEQIDFSVLKNKNVSLLYLDSNQYLWIGTYNLGVYRCHLEKGTIEHFGVKEGLIHNSVCGVLEDPTTGDFWISTVVGLSRLSVKDAKIINYTKDTGFPLNEVSRNALLQTEDGRIYIGGNNGIAEFSPEEIVAQQEKLLPVVRISSVNSLDSDEGTDQVKFDNARSLEHVELSYKNAAVSIKFSPLDYIFPKGYKYVYQMEGLDKNWNYIERNEVIYSHLPAGHYTFYVKACNSNGEWGESSAVDVVVYPPIWLTGWAKMIYVLLALTLVGALMYYLYKRKTAKYKRRIEEIEKENTERNYRMKIELFTNFSHELRTPLTLITGPSEDILQDETLPGKFLFPMKQIYKNSNRLLLLVNQLMDFRKLEYGAMMLKLSQVNIGTFLTSQIDSFSDLLHKKELTIEYKNTYYGDDLWIDMDLMEKVVFNLLSNAVKHSPKETQIKVRSLEKENHVVISVKDCGEGISEENLSKIFDLFFQVEQGSKADLFGSGIGLNMAQYVVKLHKGRIWAESVFGHGSEFFVELNLGRECFAEANVEFVETHEDTYLEKIKRECIAPIEEENAVTSDSDDRCRVLVVEDDDDMRQYVASILSKQYIVSEAVNGKDALEMAIEQIPDLIVSDVMMPVMDGLELCKAIKGEMTTAHIPVVLLTAKALNEHIEEGYGAMADDYVLKPFAPKVLLAKLESIIKNRNRLRQLFSEKLDAIEVPVDELSAEDEFLQQLMELIREKAQDPDLSVNDLYEALGMSRSQFFRKIKAISDVSPNKLILNVRMKLAAEKLATGKYTVSEVAYDVGYSDPSYFSKVFKSTYNIAPANYLKQYV